MKCEKCGTENYDDANFCESCGEKLNKEKQNNTEEKNNLKCPICGNECAKEDKFCGKCGGKLLASDIELTSITNNILHENNIKCPYCQSIVSRYVKKCPHCGEWLNGVSHFGCGGFMMITSVILAILAYMGGQELNIPIFGTVGGLFLIILAFLYFLPSLIAEWRGHDSKTVIFIVNLLFGWTLIGWILSLIFSFTGRRR